MAKKRVADEKDSRAAARASTGAPQAPPKERLLDFKKLGAIIRKNFIVIIRDKTRVIPLLMFPIFMILVFGFTTGNIPKHIPTAIVAYDSTPLAQDLQAQIAQQEVFTVRYVTSTEGEAKRLLDEGAVRVIIVLPASLDESLARGEQATIGVIVDESDAAVGATARQSLRALVDAASRRLASLQLAGFQRDAQDAALRVRAFAQGEQDLYAQVAQNAQAAVQAAEQSRRVADTAAARYAAQSPAPSVYAPPSMDNNNTKLNESYVDAGPQADAIRAQIMVLQRSSAFAGLAAIAARDAGAGAQQGHAQEQARAAAVAEEVEAPLARIEVFARTPGGAMLQPLVYEEKPAYGTGKRAVDFLIPSIIALTIFQGAIMGMGRAVAGEKREGSLTRVFLTPTSNATIILGTLIFYIVFELCRSAFIILVAMLFFHIHIEGSLLLLALILMIYTGVPTAIGMLLSSAVRTEPQYMAMAMLVSMPTMFLAGVFFPVQAMPKALQAVTKILPVTYAAEALRGVMIKGFSLSMILAPLFILLIFLAVSVTALFLAFRRDIE